jgi:CHAT domain-containing protein/pimeloyl-ACP methyl ester carboxylesterase
MASLNIRLTGEKRTGALANSPEEHTDTLTLAETYEIGTARRGEAENHHVVQLDETKVIEFVYDDETVWIGDHTTIDEVFPGTSAQLRSLEPGSKEPVEIPTEVYVGEPGRSGAVTKVLLKFVKIFTKKVVLSPLVNKLATDLEDKELGKLRGLCHLDAQFKLEKKPLETGGNYLLFLHGTASSTAGAFGELNGSMVWNYITQTFTVLAFQHETLTKSPLQNVLELVQELPQAATLTLISHSRGGLVGDILNRFCVENRLLRGFSEKEKSYLRKQDRTDDLAMIAAIEQVILSKTIRVEKFIRVACTASGTTLASRRLDIYFNVLFNIVGLASGLSISPTYTAFKDLIAALLETKDDASALPGLEVQNPRSPFNQMLNNANPEVLIDTPLIVISGDASLSRRWSAIKVALSDMFFWGDNDFVVDTRSMYNGARRAKDRVQYFFDEGADVSHFNYFKNDKTRNALMHALKSTGGALVPGFSMLETRSFTDEEIRNITLSLPGGRVFQNVVSGQKPIVVLLPGIMGSTLTVSDKLVWINFLGFVNGSLISLLNSDDNNKNVRADALVGSSYEKLTKYLSRDYDVVTFPFDWRLPMSENARFLNRKILELLQHRQPIKLIGHSMGGVLIRDFVINHPATWTELNASKDFRLVFLGSPLRGAFRIPYVLFGLDSLINTLDLIDIGNSQKDLLTVFANFPGILSLLPLTTDPDNDFADPVTWRKMRDAFGDTEWPIPGDDLLDQFRDYRDAILQKSDKIDYTNARYVAGQGRRNQQTISGYRIVEKNTLIGPRPDLEFLATKEGDESVTWDSGIPQPMTSAGTVYYSDVSHGELANDPKLFSAISDLLTTGSTNQLKRTRPAVRSIEQTFKAKATFNFDLSPEGVEKTLMGLGSDKPFTAGDVPITVSVSNGDLAYALYPLMVGHFENDGILSAEKSIDWHLEGELSRRHRLGLYPGPIGSSETVGSGVARGFQGAIIVGLGRQGFLTEYLLISTIEQGTSKYLANLNSRPAGPPVTSSSPKRIGISILLIGSGYGGISIENSVRAIVQGVQNANAKVRQIYSSPKTIDTIEFVELYKDRALSCMKAISAVEKDESRSLTIFRNGNKIKKLNGWRERLPIDDTREWWTRITVRRYRDDEQVTEEQRRGLRFAISTDAARVEERTLRTTSDTLTELLEEMSRKDDWSPELARAIFELLIPNDFKDQVKRQSNINWILDKHSAGFPWELLQDNQVNSRPLSVNAGMIRQLATRDYRLAINPVAERTAIVVGDPDLKNPPLQLAAARKEGEKVVELLSVQGFEVMPLIGTTAAQILRSLFSKNYKIVHLAGHGVFNPDPDKPTGMVIGPNAFLTPDYINQMSGVPELVFVNCCHLGNENAAAEEYSRSRFQLAANIGTQLIEIGVKAVVVAGWAVNDTAALEFAERFYQYMFEGYDFGESVKKARRTIFDNYGLKNNTWGAYQCYGDPFYKLSTDSRKAKEYYEFVIPEEAEIELGNLYNKLERGGYDTDDVLQKMDAIDKALIQAGIKSGRITELQALLYSSLNMYEKAVEKFQTLWQEERASFSFSATEKYCNTRVKLYVKQVRESGKSRPEVVEKAIGSLNEVIADMEGLIRFGATVERINIVASAYKRLAQISEGAAKREAYTCSASYYHRAYKTAGNSAKFYPLTNWLLIENALVLEGSHKWGDKGLPKKGDLQKELDDELTNIRQKETDEKEYWDWIAEATVLLCKHLLGETRDTKRKITYDDILEQYAFAWRMVGTSGQHQAEIEQFEFLEDALSMGKLERATELLGTVRRLKMALEGMV